MVKNNTKPTKTASPTKEAKASKTQQKITSNVTENTVGDMEIDMDHIVKTISVLKTMDAKHQEGQPMQLLDDGASKAVTIQFNFNKVPEKMRWTPLCIELPNPIYGVPSETCLITKDPQRTFKDILIETPVPGVVKVIGLSKLRANYKTTQQKRDLCNAFDLFLVDRDVSQHMPDILGSYFFRKSKMPVAVRFNQTNLPEVLSKSLRSTFLRIGNGSSIAVKIGTVGMDAQQLAENAKAVFVAAKAHFSPESADPIAKTLTVMRCSVHCTDQTTLPIWLNKTALVEGYQRAQAHEAAKRQAKKEAVSKKTADEEAPVADKKKKKATA